jgi:uncharacterized protein with HEPN domain
MQSVSSRNWRLRVRDILAAIHAIQERTAGLRFETFEDDETLVKAVLYDFIIIGEASANVPDEVQQRYPDLPWRLMKDMRNVAAHEYFQVDLPTIWRTIHRSLPPLVAPLETILEREELG